MNPQSNSRAGQAHTPGPWQVSSSTLVIATNDSRPMAIICNTLDLSDVSQIEIMEAAANARLISAAPSLLDALKDAEANLSYREQRDNEELTRHGRNAMPTSKTLNTIRHAIARATRETTP